MRPFDFENYKEFLIARIKAMPSGGRGELKKIAESLRVHPTHISKILHGPVELTFEQAFALGKYLGLSAQESEYFTNLVAIARAGTPEYRSHLEQKGQRLKGGAAELVNRLPSDRQLEQADRATFYSAWYYVAAALLTALPDHRTVDSLAGTLRLSRAAMREVVNFLTSSGICVEKNGLLEPGTERTHLAADSLLVARHHTNWRLRAIGRFDRLAQDAELAFTAPAMISASDAVAIRETLAQMIEVAMKKIRESGSEKLYCLNVDWFDPLA